MRYCPILILIDYNTKQLMMTLTDTLTRLKKNRSFQLGNLPDKCTSEQLLKLEYGLSQLQSVFDVVQMALRG